MKLWSGTGRESLQCYAVEGRGPHSAKEVFPGFVEESREASEGLIQSNTNKVIC
jgi:hypothetical protein